MTQLDLFDQPLRQAEMLAFPAAKLASCIRVAADRILAPGKKRAGRVGTLDYEVGILLVRYFMVGVPEGEAYRQGDAYRQAILAEISRRKATGYQDDPRGAA
jgi:hypothetical protein